jgi:hypothetical protein
VPRAASSDSPYVSRIEFIGRSSGAVKNLSGFRKQHHTVPDSVSPATLAFVAKLSARELAEEGESMFQRSRALFGYKRSDIALELASGSALLTTPDFHYLVSYAHDEADPASFTAGRTLLNLRSAEFLQRVELDELFAGRFSIISFALAGSVRVEAVVDAIEGLKENGGLAVHYPSDCRHCVVSVEGVAAEVVCDGARVEMRFPRHGSPRELAREFLVVRSAFALTKNRVLAGLL